MATNSTQFENRVKYVILSIAGSAAIHLNVIKPMVTPSVHLMNFHFLTPNGENFRIPLLEPHKLWDNKQFNRNWNTTLVVTGWNTNINSTNECVQTLYTAYKQRNINFVVCKSNLLRLHDHLSCCKNLSLCEIFIVRPSGHLIYFPCIFCTHRSLTHPISLIRCTRGVLLIPKVLGKLSVQPLLSLLMLSIFKAFI